MRIRNGCTLNYNRISTTAFPSNYWAALQSLEYLRSFLGRQGWDLVNGNFIIAGAFALFPTKLIVDLGGMFPSVAEDMEIIVRLHRAMRETKTAYKICYLADPVAWTEAPVHYQKLARQRIRWHLGVLQSLWYHKRIFLRSTYGILAFFCYPFWVIGEALEPIIELLAWVYICIALYYHFFDTSFFIMIIALSFGYTFMASLFCLHVEDVSFGKYSSTRSMLFLTVYSAIENFGYRQMTVFWRVISFGRFFKDWKGVNRDSKKIGALIRTFKTGRG